jgi:hypothetical protein
VSSGDIDGHPRPPRGGPGGMLATQAASRQSQGGIWSRASQEEPRAYGTWRPGAEHKGWRRTRRRYVVMKKGQAAANPCRDIY